ncbi:hypothetical protein [Xenorhabdus thuongxuanensis]|uniref:Uncharacterized protein n=1 Tax=Xenorhabdus thuongxuanensis TaxID=1873484 RepID=A0A1Q5U412_9GAMM|nr:hypothetical protein [Xenorhabdus thuongxuanensis]OKP07206.1 hypothetical protein Xentx_01478 [Xenorhabdus thuongxuanensis]
MKIKGASCLFFILPMWFFQAQALDLSYRSAITVDNRPSGEYLKKRFSLDSSDNENWNMDKPTKANTLAEKGEKELKEYNGKFEKKSLGLPPDWYAQSFNAYPDIQQHYLRQERQLFWIKAERLQGAN